SGGDGVGEGVAVEGGDVGGAEVDEGEDDDAVLISGGGGAGLAEALGEHGEEAGGAVFLLGGGRVSGGEAALRGAGGEGAVGGELIEDEAEGEDVGLDAGLAGDELLGRHVGDGAAAGGVGGAGYGLGRADFALADRAAGVELGLVGTEAAG